MQAKRIRMRDTTITALLGYGFSTLSLLVAERASNLPCSKLNIPRSHHSQ